MKSHELEIRYDPTFIQKEYLLQSAGKFVPSWFKNLPAKGFTTYTDTTGMENTVTTVRTCPGIVKTLSKGFIVPSPFDILIRVTGSEYSVTPPPSYKNFIHVHSAAQINNATGTDFLIIKVVTPYTAHMDKEIEFIYANPVVQNFAELHDYQIPTGIIEFKNQCSINAFIMVPMNVNKTYTVRAGTPLFQIIPLEQCRINVKYTETNLWQNPPTNTIQGISTWFDKIKYKRRLSNG